MEVIQGREAPQSKPSRRNRRLWALSEPALSYSIKPFSASEAKTSQKISTESLGGSEWRNISRAREIFARPSQSRKICEAISPRRWAHWDRGSKTRVSPGSSFTKRPETRQGIRSVTSKAKEASQSSRDRWVDRVEGCVALIEPDSIKELRRSRDELGALARRSLGNLSTMTSEIGAGRIRSGL